MEDMAIWAALHSGFSAGGTRQLLILLAQRPNAAELWELSANGWQERLPGLNQEVAERLAAISKRVSLEKTADFLAKKNIQMIAYTDEAYPQSLRNIDNPPAILYTMGNIAQDSLRIGMVGSRKCSDYGKMAAFDLAKELSGNGVCVVSGLARGIDGTCHAGAIEAQGGTIAVMGTGIDRIYPAEHKKLAQRILAHPFGMIVTELPLGSEPLPFHFPLRNRIISGLSDGVVVVEAGEKSGALITAECALEQGKDVFAVPGSIFNKQSAGGHKLIKEGAKLICSAEDVLEEYGQLCMFRLADERSQRQNDLGDDEANVLKWISSEPIQLEELGYMTKLPTNRLMSALSILEIDGLIKQLAGQKYIRLG